MRQVLVAGIAAAALLMAGAVPRPAEAIPVSKSQAGADAGSGVTLVKRGGRGGGGFRGGRGGGFKGGKSFRGGSGFAVPRMKRGRDGFARPRKGHGHRHRGGNRRFYSYGSEPYYYGYYDSYYGDRCASLRRKALRTGSRYWWRRYERCQDLYY
jgi:hypothetical protein